MDLRAIDAAVAEHVMGWTNNWDNLPNPLKPLPFSTKE